MFVFVSFTRHTNSAGTHSLSLRSPAMITHDWEYPRMTFRMYYLII